MTEGFEFTSDWFTHRIKEWRKLLSHLIDKPIRALEVGCHEGHSFTWTLTNLCTHEDSRAVAIDVWEWPRVEKLFDKNIVATGVSNKVKKIRGNSRVAINWLSDNSYDFIYIDGNHEGANTLLDGLLAYHKLKVGGIIIFDDCEGWANTVDGKKHHRCPIDAANVFNDMLPNMKLIQKDYQYAFRKES